MLKLPFVLGAPDDNSTKEDTWASIGMSFLFGIAANLGVYAGYRLMKNMKTKTKSKDFTIAYSNYQRKLANSENYIKENMIFYERSYNIETKNRGLIIIEAYFGLAEHIYQIEAGLLKPVNVQSEEDYAKYQLVPVTK